MRYIVVDNASSDDSIEELETTFIDESRLKVVRNSENLGFAAGCNIGAKLATGHYILFLNPDCLLQEGAVAQLVSVLEAEPLTGMAPCVRQWHSLKP